MGSTGTIPLDASVCLFREGEPGAYLDQAVMTMWANPDWVAEGEEPYLLLDLPRYKDGCTLRILVYGPSLEKANLRLEVISDD